MPLLDHFHAPLKHERHWESFHSFWTSEIVRQLNQSVLPEDYVAEPTVKLGVEVEADVGTLEEPNGRNRAGSENNGGVATAVWAPPQPALAFAVDFANQDTFEVKVQKDEGGWRLVAAIELVSPGNKDRPATRQAFLRKCASYLQEGVSVIVVDVGTKRTGNLHADLVAMLNPTVTPTVADPRALYAAAYRTVLAKEGARIETWPHLLELGHALPTLPLWLDVDLAVPVDLEESYRASCETLRIATS